MEEYFFLIYYFCLAVSTSVSIIRYKEADSALRVVIWLLAFTALCEVISYSFYKLEKYEWRTLFYHFSSIARMMIVITYFLTLWVPQKLYKLLAFAFPVWLTLALLNIIYFEPLTVLNSNMLILEGFIAITLSLFSIYRLLLINITHSIFMSPHFWIAVILLLLYSCTFFFWAFIKILYNMHWSYMSIILCMQISVDAIVYTGIGVVLFLYPKMNKLENR